MSEKDLDSTSAKQTFGHYTLLEELGRGGQGTVWLAEDSKLKRKVALKLLRTATGTVDERQLERFRREAEAASKLDHPNICALFDAGEVDGARLAPRPSKVVPRSVQFGAEGRLIVCYAAGVFGTWEPGETFHPIGEHGANAVAIFSHGAEKILSCGADHLAKLWTRDGRLLRTYRGHRSPILLARFSPTDDMIYTASRGGTVRVWKITGECVATLTGHAGMISGLDVSPDGRWLVTGSADGTVRKWLLDFAEVARRVDTRLEGKQFTADELEPYRALLGDRFAELAK